MLCIVLGLHDQRYSVFVAARQAPVTSIPIIEDGFQLAQIAPRKFHVYPLPNDRDEHLSLL